MCVSVDNVSGAAVCVSVDIVSGAAVCVSVDIVSGAAVCVSCLLYTSPSPRDRQKSRMPSSA